MGSAADDAGRKGDGFGKKMGGALSLAGKAAALGSAAVVTGIGVSISKAMDFDKTMRTVGATLGTSGPVQKELTALALQLGKETVFSAADASDAMLELAKGGLSAAQIKAGALSATMTLATAGGLDMASAATYMGNALNTFGLKAKDANAVAAALAGGANASSASVESLGLALSQVGPGAKTAGLSLQTTTAILAAFDNAGIKGSDAGTSLKTMLTRLVPEGKKATNMMHDLGLKFTDSSGKFLPMTAVAQQLQDKLKGLSAEQQTVAMKTIFGSDATRAATVLMNLGAAGVAKYTKATSDQGAAQRMAKTATEGASGAWEAFKGSIETIAITLGTKLLPMFTGVVEQANSIAGAVIDNMGPALDGLSPTVKDIVGEVKGFITEFQNAEGAGDRFRDVLAEVRDVGDKLPGLIGNVKSSLPAMNTGLDTARGLFRFLGEHMDAVRAAIPYLLAGWAAYKALQVANNAVGKNSLIGFGLQLTATFSQVAANFALSSSQKALTAALNGTTGAQKVGILTTLRQRAATLLSTAGQYAAAAASKVLAAGQWLVNAALTANPIGLVIVAVAGLAAGLIYAYQTSEKFRSYVSTAFSVVKIGALSLATVSVKAFRFLSNVFMEVVGQILDGAASAFGWVPGIGPQLQGAAAQFRTFKTSANTALNAIENDLQVNIDTENAKTAVEELHRQFLDAGWTVTAAARVNMTYAGNGQMVSQGGGSGGGTGGAGGSLSRPVNVPAGFPWGHYPSGGVHRALDFPAPLGTPVRAMMSGQVVRDGIDPGGFGLHLRTRDADGNYTIFGHMSKELVGVGQRVSAGQAIGEVGSTGRSSGNHLHVERRGSLNDPLSAFDFTSALSAIGTAAKPLLFDSGGILPPGVHLVANQTRKPEPLARVDQSGGGIVIQNAHFHGVQDVPGMVRELQDYADRNGGLRIKMA